SWGIQNTGDFTPADPSRRNQPRGSINRILTQHDGAGSGYRQPGSAPTQTASGVDQIHNIYSATDGGVHTLQAYIAGTDDQDQPVIAECAGRRKLAAYQQNPSARDVSAHRKIAIYDRNSWILGRIICSPAQVVTPQIRRISSGP